MTTLPADTGPTKREIIEQAFEECGQAAGEFGIEPHEVTMALRRLNTMMGEWPWSALGYLGPDVGVGSASDGSGLAADAVGAVVGNLALRIAPALGKTLSAEQRAAASRSLLTMQSQYASIPEQDFPAATMRGQGARYTYAYFPEA